MLGNRTESNSSQAGRKDMACVLARTRVALYPCLHWRIIGHVFPQNPCSQAHHFRDIATPHPAATLFYLYFFPPPFLSIFTKNLITCSIAISPTNPLSELPDDTSHQEKPSFFSSQLQSHHHGTAISCLLLTIAD